MTTTMSSSSVDVSPVSADPAKNLHLLNHVISGHHQPPADSHAEPQLHHQPAAVVVPPSTTKPPASEVKEDPAPSSSTLEESITAAHDHSSHDHDASGVRCSSRRSPPATLSSSQPHTTTHNSPATTSRNEVSLSQRSADDQVLQLEHSGDLDAVAGSQSVLSQELMILSSQDEALNISIGDDQHNSNSQATETSTSMAQRLGLIRQDTVESSASSNSNHELSEKQKESSYPTNEEAVVVQAQAPVAAEEEESSYVAMSQESLPLSQDPVILEEQERAAATGTLANNGTPAKSNRKVSYTSPAPPPTKHDNDASNMFSPKGSMRDTPIRNSKNFGSLLNAVQMITSQETVSSELYKDLEESASTTSAPPGNQTKGVTGNGRAPKKGKAASTASTGKSKQTTNSSSKKRPVPPPPLPPPPTYVFSEEAKRRAREHALAPTAPKSNPGPRTKIELLKARRAAALAEQTITDPEMAKKLLLSMALVRENPRQAPDAWPKPGSVVPEGFFWAHYPPLENVLKDHMAGYYELSTTACQSAEQQKFNNKLVDVIRAEANKQKWIFSACFNDKGLRDRIRCYYKTHIQNAKKRLRTMVRNPTKKANARHLCAHLDLIEQAKIEEERRTRLALMEQMGNGTSTAKKNKRTKITFPKLDVAVSGPGMQAPIAPAPMVQPQLQVVPTPPLTAAGAVPTTASTAAAAAAAAAVPPQSSNDPPQHIMEV